MGFRPLHDRVVVKRLDSESKTAGGIIIPDTAKEKPMEGKVIAVGPGARAIAEKNEKSKNEKMNNKCAIISKNPPRTPIIPILKKFLKILNPYL